MTFVLLTICAFSSGVSAYLLVCFACTRLTGTLAIPVVRIDFRKHDKAIGSSAVFVAFLVFSGRPILAALSGGAVFHLFSEYHSLKLKRKLENFESQLVEALALIASSVRAGNSLLQALEEAARELKEPLGIELLAAVNSVKMGIPVHDALARMAERNPCKELKSAVMSINIARETGGNMGDALARISESISGRKKMRAKIFALTSQGRASGKVMSAIPFFLLLILYLMEPDLTGLLFSTVPGNLMLAAVAAMILTGGLLMKKITRIEM